MKKHLVFIVNPYSGTLRDKNIEQDILQYLDQEQFSYEIQYTRYAHEGELLARNAALNKAYAAVAVGGDGSMNDVVNGIMGTQTHLALVPLGSGNGLARSLNIPLNLSNALLKINENNLVCIDAIAIEQRYALSNLGFGFDAAVCQCFQTSRKRGFLSYMAIILKLLLSYKCHSYKIQVDQNEPFETEAFIINIANGTFYGYNYTIADQALLNDGKLDLVIIRKFPKILAPILALRMITKSLSKSKYVQHCSFEKLSIIQDKNEGNSYQVDGEACVFKTNRDTKEVKIVKSALKVLA